MDSNPGLKKLVEMYNKLGYFDKYGGSLIILIIVTIIIFIAISYCISKSNAQVIIEDWQNQRCKLSIIPYAGYITHPEGTTAFEYTQENFNYCTQQILASITSPALEPFTFIIEIFNLLVKVLNESMQAVRGVFARIRTLVTGVVRNIVNRLLNIMIPIQQIILGTRDIMHKTQGVMATILFSTLGAYISLKSLLGAIAQFIANILIALAILIAILFVASLFIPSLAFYANVMKFTFILISIPFALMLAMMGEIFHIYAYSIPKLKCFDKSTLIQMNDGSSQPISEIKEGDILANNNEVTGVIMVETKGSTMYYLDGILVSDTHIVNYHGKWIPVSQHPDSFKCVDYNEPFLYCLNTSNKTISINNYLFTDWDEICEKNMEKIMKKNGYIQLKQVHEIHRELDGGFVGSTLISLHNGESKCIQNIAIGDKLLGGEEVYGIVKINGANLSHQYKFILGKDFVVEGGPNLVLSNSNWNSTLGFSNKVEIEKKHNVLWHLLTDKKTFTIGKHVFYDYNAAIDLFLEKNDEKLLSMKYV
jgi:hypothetical protein